MKDSKFIELLNLYVDHQISAEEAALLEAEIHRDPERRRVYRQYCQMQKACVMLADSFRTEAPAAGNVVAFAPPRRRLQAVAYTMGALAAAACVALVMVSRDRGPVTPAAPALAVAPARAATVAARSAPEPLPARLALQPVFAAAVRDNATSAVATSDRGEFEWMRRVQLQRVPNVQELWFESRPTIQPQDLSFPTRANVTEEPSVGVAVRFQR
jgi:hypothetical protein